MSKPYVVCVGGVPIDITCVSKQKLNMGGKNPFAEVVVDAGGVTRNAAEVLCRLGVNVSVLAAVGDDNFARDIMEICQGAGLDMSHVKRVAGKKSTISIQMIDYDGEVAVMAADAKPESELDLTYIKSQQDFINNAACLLICPTLATDVLDYLFENFAHVPKFMDVCALQFADKIKPYLPYIHTLKANEEEAKALCDIALDGVFSFWRMSDQILAMGAKNLVITLGSRGAIYTNELECNLYPAKKVSRVINATGAGDSFFAGLVYGFLMDLPTPQTMELAAACSRMTIQSPHTISPEITLDRVQAEINA